jgi:hypothetical protein
MQMQIFRRIGFGLLALGLTLSTFAVFGCSSGDNGTERNAALFGANERPTPVTSQGTGTAVLTISSDQTQISYVLTYNGLANVTQAHIHVGDPNTAGPIILFLCTNIGGAPAGAVGAQACPQGSEVTVTGTLTAIDLVTPNTAGINSFSAAVTQLDNGNTYSNVHTQANPGGEIRGQNL